MKTHRIFNKGQFVYCLLASHTNPNILLPVKGVILDSKWDPVNPLYQIRIIKLYDNMKFLKQHFFGMNFRHEFENRARKMILKAEDFKTAKVLPRAFLCCYRICYVHKNKNWTFRII